VRAALVLLTASITYAAVSMLLAAMSLGILAGQLRERWPSEVYSPADRDASVGFLIYFAVLCLQAGVVTLTHIAVRKVRWTKVPGYFVVYCVLAFAVSIVFAWFLAEIGERLELVRITVDLATKLIRYASKL